MQQDTSRSGTPQKENEVDLGVFFTIMSRFFNKIGAFFLYIIQSISRFVIYFLLLIKRNFLWLALGGVAGAVYGIWQDSLLGKVYVSTMVVKTNFETNQLLYQKVEYLNALIGEGQSTQLQKMFNIDANDVMQLMTFRIKPVSDQLENAKLYKKNFLDYKRTSLYAYDTGFARVIKYNDFIENLSDYDYPVQSIELYSHNPLIYSKIQQGFINLIAENPDLKRRRDSVSAMLQAEQSILTNSLIGVDSLRKAYYAKISKGGESKQEVNVVLPQGALLHAPEIDLFDKELQLKDELMETKKRSIEQSEALQVYAGFNGVGKKTNALKEGFFSWAWKGAAGVFVIILLLLLYKNLNIIDKSRKQAKTA